MTIPNPTYQLETYQTFNDWQAAWDNLKRIDYALPWAIGDLYNYGSDKFGEMVSQALDPEITEGHFTKGSITQYAFVARQWPVLSRLNLPWSYHQTVASLPIEQRLVLLQHCQENDIKRAELRQMVRELNAGQQSNPPTNGNDTNHLLQMENHQKDKEIEQLREENKQLKQAVIMPAESPLLPLPSTGPELTKLDWNGLLQVKDTLIDNGYQSVTIHANGDITWYK